MKKLFKITLVLTLIFSFSNIYSQVKSRGYRPIRPAKVVVVKPAKKIKAGKWQNLGTKTVNLKEDSDQLLVTAYEGAFTKVKFKITKAPVHINSMTIIFLNGESKHIVIDKNFPKGTTSNIIDLPGNQRIIQKIKFNYQTINTQEGKAKVTVLGMH